MLAAKEDSERFFWLAQFVCTLLLNFFSKKESFNLCQAGRNHPIQMKLDLDPKPSKLMKSECKAKTTEEQQIVVLKYFECIWLWSFWWGGLQLVQDIESNMQKRKDMTPLGWCKNKFFWFLSSPYSSKCHPGKISSEWISLICEILSSKGCILKTTFK